VASKPIAVAVAGVGNCASSFVQAVTAAKEGTLGTAGVAHPYLGGYGLEDISVVAAFDVDARKVGRDLADAIRAMPNCTSNHVNVSATGVRVLPGPVGDGVPPVLSGTVEVCEESGFATFERVADGLRASKADVLVNYLPTGSRMAVSGYAGAALDAGVAFVNCNPELIANDASWQERYRKAGLPLLGDDIRSQLGATRIHQTILDLCRAVGAVPGRTYQLNHGGNTDFLNMREPARSASKKRSKEGAIGSVLPVAAEYAAGPAGYVQFLGDQKVAYIRVEGQLLFGSPFSMELRLQVEDSPNSAGVVIDAVRAARIALDRGHGGVVTDACPYLFKSPPERFPESEVTARFDAFGRGTPLNGKAAVRLADSQ
jgi:myo-inositol-1-phosphate synthase